MAGEILGVNFDGAYERFNVQIALADLISQDIEDKPIIALHHVGCNTTKDLKFIHEVDMKQIHEGIKDGSEEVRKQLLELSKAAIEKEFDAMFALLKEKERPVLYIRWIPKSSEIFQSEREFKRRCQFFGHFICLYFFYDHNNDKSILISNPNSHEIEDEHEVAAISSYLKEHSNVQIYHTRDYLQFDNTFCSLGSLIALRALYNTDRDRLNEVLQNGQQKNIGFNFQYTSIELGDTVLQKEIGIVPQNEDERKRLARVLRQADEDTAKACEGNSLGVSYDDENFFLPYFKNVSCNEKLLTGNFTKDQRVFLEKVLLSGQKLLTEKQIQQVKKLRREKIGKLKRDLQSAKLPAQNTDTAKYPERQQAESNPSDSTNNPRQTTLQSSETDKAIITTIESTNSTSALGSKDQRNDGHKQQQTPILQAGSKPNNIRVYSFLVIGAIVGAAVAYLAGAATLTPLSVAVAMFIVSAAIGALVGYGIGKVSSKFLDPSITVPDPKGQGV